MLGNLLQKAKDLVTPEPQKSFRKLGVVDTNDNLTSEGKELLLSFLMKKYGKEFNEEVVQPILKQEEESKK